MMKLLNEVKIAIHLQKMKTLGLLFIIYILVLKVISNTSELFKKIVDHKNKQNACRTNGKLFSDRIPNSPS